MPPRLKKGLKKARIVRGVELRRLRTAKGWTQSDCADRLETTYQTWQRYEAGTSWPSRDREILICDILRVPRLHFVETKQTNGDLTNTAKAGRHERTIEEKLREVLQANPDDYDQPSEIVRIQTRLMQQVTFALSKAHRALKLRGGLSPVSGAARPLRSVEIRKTGNR